MRIIHIIDYFQPQLGYQETFLAKAQSAMEHDVYVLTSDRYSTYLYQGNSAKTILGERIKGTGFFIEEGIKTFRLNTQVETPYTIWLTGLESKIKELEPDIVHMHGIPNISAIRIGIFKLKYPYFKLVYDDHATFHNSRSNLYPIFRWLFSRIIQRSADAIVGVVPETKQFMIRNYGISAEIIHIIPLGADDTLFKFDICARREVRKKLNLLEDDILFIYAGKIIPVKKLEILIDAIKNFQNNEHIKVMLLGQGPSTYIEELKRKSIENHVHKKIIWHDFVPNRDLYKFYSAADVAVWPSEATAGIQEAMSCGLPIIISKNSRVTELIRNNNGLLCEEDPNNLAEKMGNFIELDVRERMGFRSRELIEKELSWKSIACQFLNLVNNHKT